MLTTKDQIHMIKTEIKKNEEELSLMNPNDPNNRFSYANKKSELNILKDKLIVLEKRLQDDYKSDKYSPTIGDERYKDFPHKAPLDELRIKHFSLFNLDPLIEYQGNGPMFDYSLSAYADFYKVEGIIPFKLAFSSIDSRLPKDDRATLGINIKTETFSKLNEKQIEFLTRIIKDYTNNNINLILTDGPLDSIIFARIANKEFNYTAKKDKDYYLFFKELCSNTCRNIIYIGDSLKEGAISQSIFDTEISIINQSKKEVMNLTNASDEQLERKNEEIKGKILRYN